MSGAMAWPGRWERGVGALEMPPTLDGEEGAGHGLLVDRPRGKEVIDGDHDAHCRDDLMSEDGCRWKGTRRRCVRREVLSRMMTWLLS